MVRARHRWHWLCRCTGLGQPELAAKNRPVAESRALVLVLLSISWRLLALAIGIETAERPAGSITRAPAGGGSPTTAGSAL